MRNKEKLLKLILRVFGLMGAFAAFAVIMPYFMMNRIYGFMGMGTLPDEPLVGYLARTLSAFYTVAGVVLIMVSSDIQKYHSMIKVLSIIGIAGSTSGPRVTGKIGAGF